MSIKYCKFLKSWVLPDSDWQHNIRDLENLIPRIPLRAESTFTKPTLPSHTTLCPHRVNSIITQPIYPHRTNSTLKELTLPSPSPLYPRPTNLTLTKKTPTFIQPTVPSPIALYSYPAALLSPSWLYPHPSYSTFTQSTPPSQSPHFTPREKFHLTRVTRGEGSSEGRRQRENLMEQRVAKEGRRKKADGGR